MYSLTLQNAAGDNVITSGDILGRINFAAPSESDGAASTYIASQIYCQAEGSFTSESNPAGLILATSSADSAPASGRLKVSSDGHFIPLFSGTYDLGSASLPFRNLYVDGGYVTAPTGVFDVISFNVEDESVLTKGQISWDDTEGTMDIGLTDNTSIHIGSHRYFRIRNSTGDVLYKGQAVYATGVHENGIIEPAKYVADGTIREVRFMGLMLEDVNNNNNGYAIDFGHLEEMDLDGSATNFAVGDETWNAGDILYVHPTEAGKLTKVEPKHSISVAIVLDKGNGNGNGRMFVRPISYGHLDDNHDVNTSGVINGQILRYISSTDTWTTGIIYDTGNVGINTASPQAKLDLNGSLIQESGSIVFNNYNNNYDFTVKGTSDNYLLFTNADANAVQIGALTAAGKLAIDTTKTNTTTYTLHSVADYYSTANGSYFNFGVYNETDKYVNVGVNDTGYGMSSDLVSRLQGNGTLSSTYGLRTYAGIGTSSSAGINTTAYGIQSRVINNGTGTSLIGEARGIDIYINGDLANNKASVGITTAKSLNIQAILDATNKWAIYQEGANDRNYFNGSVGIGTSSPSATTKLQVEGGDVIFNDNAGNYDFRIESTGNPSMFYLDASADAIGIGTSTPSSTLHIRKATVPSLRIHASSAAGTAASRADRGHIIFPSRTEEYDHIKLISWGREGSFLAGMLGINISNAAGVSSEVLTIDNQSTVSTFGLRTYNIPLVTTSGNVIFNTTEDNYDFTVKGDGDAELLVVDASTDRVGIGTATPTEKLDINSDAIRLRTSQTPASATAAGNAGDICWDSNYIYVCVATNTWKRSAISTWP